MATSTVIKLFGLVLFAIILQATRLSALECYECYGYDGCELENVPNKFLVTEASLDEVLKDQTRKIKEVLIAKELKPINESYCVKWRGRGGGLSRYIMPQGPRASDLDESGCIGSPDGRFCFCNQNKCNNGSILQFNENSALQCYGCLYNPDHDLSQDNQKECSEDNLPSEFLMNLTIALSHSIHREIVGDFLGELIMLKEIPMRPGPFCVKISPQPQENDTGVVFRSILHEAPEASSMDKYGCIEYKNYRACFCNQDKCNGGPLQCYGCIVGADKELSELNREACLEENPPDSLVVNATGSIPLFDRFLDGLTNYTVNSLETTKGPFCVKVSHEEERFMFRYIVTEGPDAKYLDGEGCMGVDNGHRICFCKEDKCNSGC